MIDEQTKQLQLRVSFTQRPKTPSLASRDPRSWLIHSYPPKAGAYFRYVSR